MAVLLVVLVAFENVFLVLFLLLYFVFLKARKKFSRNERLVLLFLSVLFLIRTEIEIKLNHTNLSGAEQSFFLVMDEIAKINGDQVTIQGRDLHRSEKLLVKYKLTSEEEKLELQNKLASGLRCEINGYLEIPSTATNENAFDYQRYLQVNQIHWILKPEKISISSCEQKPTIFHSIKNVRLKGIQYIQTHFPLETIPLAAALLFGNSDLIQPETMDHYRELGIVHLLAISGLHISIIVAIVYFLLLRFGLTREKCILILLVCLPIYCLLTGASPSIIRSVLMTMLLLIGKRWEKYFRLKAIDIISITFLLFVFIKPYSIYNIGFQLSFLVTFTLIISISSILQRYNHPVSILLTTSFLSLISSSPVLLSYFYEFSIISVIVNLIYVPLFNLVLLPFLLFVFILHLFLRNGLDPFLYLLNNLIVITNTLSKKIATFPFNTIVLGKPSMTLLFLYIGGFFLFFIFWEKRVKGFRSFICACLLPFFLFFSQYIVTSFPIKGEITFLDVGQGDSIFIRLPFGKGVYLIDTGGGLEYKREEWQVKDRNFEVGKDTVVPFLKGKGISKIDKLIITHGDLDHAGGATAILKEMKVKELVLPDQFEKNDIVNKLITIANKKTIKVRFVHDGDSWIAGENQFRILSPNENSRQDSNNSSVVLFAELGGLKWLFTGDLEKTGEEKLIKDYPELSVDVLKVGHHGSNTSTTDSFLHYLNPKIAIISVGRNNPYKHPHQEVLKRLEEKNIKIGRTDNLGAITYTFSKDTGTFSTYPPYDIKIKETTVSSPHN